MQAYCMTCIQAMTLTARADYGLLCGRVNDDQCFSLPLDRRGSRATWVRLLGLCWCHCHGPASLGLGSLVPLCLLVVATGGLRGRVGWLLVSALRHHHAVLVVMRLLCIWVSLLGHVVAWSTSRHEVESCAGVHAAWLSSMAGVKIWAFVPLTVSGPSTPAWHLLLLLVGHLL